MPGFMAKKERRLLEAARRDKKESRYFEDLEEALNKRQIKPNDFSIRDVFLHMVDDGHEIVESWNPMQRGGRGGHGVQLLEAGVDTSAFQNIMGQIVYSKVMEAWNNPILIGDKLVDTIQTSFNGEKIPGVTQLGDGAEVVSEGDPYPMLGISEEWIDTPQTTKRGFIVPVTKEAVFFDRTGLVLKRAGDTTNWLAINKEKRIIDAVCGIVDLYRRNGAAAVATYSDTLHGDNIAASNTLVDWTDIENVLLLFDALTDPNTAEPILTNPNTLIVPSALIMTAKRVLQSTELRFGDGASNTTQQIFANPVAGMFQILSNQYVKARTSSASTYFLGEPKKAFAYMQNWPITSVQAPPSSELEFTNDIVSRFKVSERGAVAVLEPRHMVKGTT